MVRCTAWLRRGPINFLLLGACRERGKRDYVGQISNRRMVWLSMDHDIMRPLLYVS